MRKKYAPLSQATLMKLKSLNQIYGRSENLNNHAQIMANEAISKIRTVQKPANKE